MRLKVPMQVQPTVDVQLTGDDDKALVREMIYLFSWATEIPYWTHAHGRFVACVFFWQDEVRR